MTLWPTATAPSRPAQLIAIRLAAMGQEGACAARERAAAATHRRAEARPGDCGHSLPPLGVAGGRRSGRVKPPSAIIGGGPAGLANGYDAGAARTHGYSRL